MATVQFTHTETNPGLDHGEGGGRREFTFTEDYSDWHGDGGGRRVITHTEEIYLEFWAIGPSDGIAARLMESDSI